MSRFTVIALALLFSCDIESDPQAAQSRKASQAANSIRFDANAEIESITRRLELTSNPGLVGFILLLNDAGQPILYTTVKGKVTSGGKRLSNPGWCPMVNGDCPSDEGTFGSSNPYIYFWTEVGQYVQWSGDYLYSDKPIRPNIEPLVIEVRSTKKDEVNE